MRKRYRVIESTYCMIYAANEDEARKKWIANRGYQRPQLRPSLVVRLDSKQPKRKEQRKT